MSGTGYVATGYALTAASLGGYWLRVRVATASARRRAESARRPATVARRSATAPVREP